MSTVRVSFEIEADDPDHETGVTEATYEKLTDDLLQTYGAENIVIEKI